MAVTFDIKQDPAISPTSNKNYHIPEKTKLLIQNGFTDMQYQYSNLYFI
jgi:hypothetical protein